MILAIGIDLIEVERIRRAVDHPQWGERFRHRVFTAGEIAYCEKRARYAESFAARFAAKEAAMKALGSGYGDGVGWRDIEVVRTSGRPTLVLSGGASQRAAAIGAVRFHLSLTHTAVHAMAQVVAEAEDPGRVATAVADRRASATPARAPRPRGRR
jgi:holo-[acyl-carrier protein] synthase